MQSTTAETDCSSPPNADFGGREGAELFGPYHGAIRSALIQQLVVLLLTALNLDGGRTFKVSAIACLGYWAATTLILWRRPQSPSRSDLALVRYGFWLFLILTQVLSPIVWSLTGQV